MGLKTEKANDVTVVSFEEENLDASNVRDFKCDIGPILQETEKLVVDMSALRFVDSSGLGALLSCLRQLTSKGGKLVVSSLAKPVRTLFELVRLERVFDIAPNKEEAVARLSASAEGA
jgi:anti-sigma B factor antagonist